MSIFFKLYKDIAEDGETLKKRWSIAPVEDFVTQCYSLVSYKFYDIEDSYMDIENYAEKCDLKYKETTTELVRDVLKICQKLIFKNYDLTLEDRNNVSLFLNTAIKTDNHTIPDIVVKKYMTIAKYCEMKNINANKIKLILKNKKYYSNKFDFMPSTKAIKTNKVYISTYTIGEVYKIYSNRCETDFYILWNVKFLNTMVNKYYIRDKKDDFYEKHRYRTPRSKKELLRRIKELIDIIYNLYDYYEETGLDKDDEDYHYDMETVYDKINDSFEFLENDYNLFSKSRYEEYQNYNHFKEAIEEKINDSLNLLENNLYRVSTIESFKQLKKILLKYINHYKKKYI